MMNLQRAPPASSNVLEGQLTVKNAPGIPRQSATPRNVTQEKQFGGTISTALFLPRQEVPVLPALRKSHSLIEGD
jgi:hypothetical protein